MALHKKLGNTHQETVDERSREGRSQGKTLSSTVKKAQRGARSTALKKSATRFGAVTQDPKKVKLETEKATHVKARGMMQSALARARARKKRR